MDLNIISKIKNITKSDNYILETDYCEDNDYFKALEYYGYINRGMCRSKATLTAQTSSFVDPNDVFVRGLGGEILRGMFNKSVGPNRDLENFQFALKLYQTHRVENPSREFHEFITDAYKGFFDRINIDSVNLYNYDFGDFLYWEQRMSMWASSLLNEGDPAIKNFAGINSRKMFQLAYGLSPRPRFKKNLILKIMACFDRDLAEIPYN